MTRESQIGLTLVLILCGVFGFFVYKKISNPTAAIAAAPEAGGSAPETPPTDAGTPADLPGEQPNEDLLKVASKDSPLAAPATFNRKLPDTPVAAPPRTPVEPKAKPFPDDDVFGTSREDRRDSGAASEIADVHSRRRGRRVRSSDPTREACLHRISINRINGSHERHCRG